MTMTPAYKRLTQMHPDWAWHGNARPAAASSDIPSVKDTTEDLAAAFRAGEAAGRLAAEQEGRLDRDLVEQAHRDEVRGMAETWANELSPSLTAGLEAMRHELSTSIMRLLRPLIERWVTAEIMDAFGVELHAAMEKSSTPTVSIRGPAALIGKLRSEFAANGYSATFEDNAEAEVQLTIDQMLVETQIGKWLSLIEAAT